MTPTTKHFVEFFSPGTFVSESSRREIPSWDILTAVEMANGIKERHNAKPYGFRFSTCLVCDPIPDGRGGTMKVESKQTAQSEMHYLGGVVKKYDDIPESSETSILRSNMSGNGYPLVIENNNSWRFTTYFEGRDCIVGPDGKVERRADDADLLEYSAAMKAKWDQEFLGRLDPETREKILASRKAG